MGDEHLKVFISWSGDRARAVGAVLHNWLPTMFDQVRPWMSDVDIAAGSRGLTEIELALVGTKFGVIVTTRANQHAPWLNFEAGALSKAIGNDPAFVAPLLVDFERESDVTGPLQQFQSNLATEQGVRRIIASIAAILSVDKAAWEPRFKALWPGLSEELTAAAQTPQESDEPVVRSQDDLLAEILAHVRSLVRSADSPTLPRKTRTAGDDLDAFLKSIDWDVRSTMWTHNGDELRDLRIGLAQPVNPQILQAARQAIMERFGVDAEIRVIDPPDQP